MLGTFRFMDLILTKFTINVTWIWPDLFSYPAATLASPEQQQSTWVLWASGASEGHTFRDDVELICCFNVFSRRLRNPLVTDSAERRSRALFTQRPQSQPLIHTHRRNDVLARWWWRMPLVPAMMALMTRESRIKPKVWALLVVLHSRCVLMAVGINTRWRGHLIQLVQI